MLVGVQLRDAGAHDQQVAGVNGLGGEGRGGQRAGRQQLQHPQARAAQVGRDRGQVSAAAGASILHKLLNL